MNPVSLAQSFLMDIAAGMVPEEEMRSRAYLLAHDLEDYRAVSPPLAPWQRDGWVGRAAMWAATTAVFWLPAILVVWLSRTVPAPAWVLGLLLAGAEALGSQAAGPMVAWWLAGIREAREASR